MSSVAIPDEYAVTGGGESYSSTVASALSDISHAIPTHAGDGADEDTVISAEDMNYVESQSQLNSTSMNTRLVTDSQLYCYFSTYFA